MSFKEFHQQIQEAFDTKVKYEVIKQGVDKFSTSALIGDRRITFTAELADGSDEYEDKWDVYFVQTTPQGQSMTFDATGSGNELEVFSMVRQSMEQFIRGYDPKQITFTASKLGGATRANLYDRLMRKFAAGKYVITRDVDHQEDVFTLTRKD